MTPAIAEALASVLDIIGAHCDANEGRDIWPSGLAFAGDRLGVALGLDIDARWQDVAEALRALARPSTVDRLSDAVDKIEHDTNAALLVTITAAHAGDLSAASESATLAFALLGLDSAFRVRVERPDVGLPEGWKWLDAPTFKAYAIRPEVAWCGVSCFGDLHFGGGFGATVEYVPISVFRAVLLRAAGVAS